MSDMLLEVDEALRAQQIKALWDKYGQWLIGLALSAILATAVGVTWHNHTNAILSEQSAKLLSVLQNENENANTSKELAGLSAQADMPLKSVAELYQAQKLEQAKDLKAAQNVYGEMIRNARSSDIMKNLARVHYVRLGLVQQQKAESLLPIIDPVTQDDSQFKGSGMELKALLLQLQGKNAEANKIFSAIAADETLPPSLRQRAKTLIRYETNNAK